ncbi:MAG: outer membrane lipoprotein-sorting protein [Spirochaetales bacterium]|nr:outer membrane lipoprotein-sorting protein [Spirochaetales bacterium]
MKKSLLIYLIFLLGTTLFSLDFQALLAEADSLVNFPDSDFQARYSIVQDIPGEGRITTVASVFRRDRAEAYTIVIEEPLENRGQGYLKNRETLWIYDPESHQFNSTSSSDRFQNSNARNSDFTNSTLARDYKVLEAEEVTLGQYKCWLLDLEGVTDDLTYPKMKIWIDENKLVRKTEDYSLSGQLLRISVFPSYHRLGENFVLHKVLYVDHLEGAMVNGKFENETTQVSIESPSLTTLPDFVFSKTFLERMSK